MLDLQLLQQDLNKIFESSDYNVLFKSITQHCQNNGDKITAVCKMKKWIFMLKVYADSNVECSNDRPNGQNSPYVETEILRLLNELHDQSPCIPILIAVHKMNEAELKRNIKSIQKCIHSKDEMCTLWNSLNIGRNVGGPTFIITEAGNINLYTFCQNASTHVDAWMIISFVWMILYTLYIIKLKYPKFVHGDLYARNIILCFDYDYIKDNSLASQHYLKFENSETFYVPYIGIVPKIIDYELAILNDDLFAKQNIGIIADNGKTDDVLQLLYSIRNIYKFKNFVTDMLDRLLGIDIGTNISYIQAVDIIKRNGGMIPLEKMLKSDVFNYHKKSVDKDHIWGEW